MEAIYPVVIIHIVFLLILVLSLRKNPPWDKFIIIWLILFAVQFFLFGLYYFNVRVNPILVQTLGISIIFLHGPLLFFLTNEFYQKPLPGLTRFYHLIPFLLVLAFTGISFIPNPAQDLIKSKADVIWGFIETGKIMSGYVYVTLVLFMVNNTDKKVLYKTLPGRLSLGLLAVWVMSTGNHFLIELDMISVNSTNFIIFLSVGLFIFYMSFEYIKSLVQFVGHKQQRFDKINWGQYQKSTLDGQTITYYGNILQKAVENDRLFLNSELSLHELSSHTGIPAHSISQTLNRGFNMTYYQFINQFRVREFINKVISDPNSASFTYEALAKECGFKSKSSFNKYFKKYTGLSPREYFNGG